ncbi:hypothetical protein DFJ58DRAFT_731730 [Suillus subalutaceus]|uniref:uncharacterized protein n=1 Tax=Suillus subalutaceus TaxID=48586 RepID=UPI001B87EA3D|nr:uncharacterized protein DFJ58DRAFT_731730 [Suillus subalutaceus]KAG1843314.1 hypothetical protein DFJ58DRAFT_731730 [Suillus subalutaceus]
MSLSSMELSRCAAVVESERDHPRRRWRVFIQTHWAVTQGMQNCSPLSFTPLRPQHKKFGIYRTVVQHLQDARSEEAARHRNTYLSVMRYLNDVRIAFLDDAGTTQALAFTTSVARPWPPLMELPLKA